ncbi:MAG: maltose ABC transporter permease MalF [Firmicutes bacterium]|nr:maltose ABC transporter permease MalF [Bacillota bacterium]
MFRFSGLLLKIAALGVFDALAVWAAAGLLAWHNYGLAAALLIGAALINYAVFNPKAVPARYLLPAFIAMAAMVVYPILYTMFISFTNYGTGHILSQEGAVDQFTNAYYAPPEAKEYPFHAYGNDAGDLRFLLITARDQGLLTRGGGATALEEVSLSAPGFKDEDGDGVPDAIGGYARLSRLKLISKLSDLQETTLSYGESVFRLKDLEKFAEVRKRYDYHPKSEVLTDLVTGKTYVPVKGTFTAADGTKLDPGFQNAVGWDNYLAFFTDDRVSGPFLRVFIWTFEWAFLSVFMTFGLGLSLALMLNDSRLRLRKFYRMLLIIPYAFPGFISALIWAGFFNTEVGIVNRILGAAMSVTIPWFQDPFWARVAVLVVNLWLGFPYMMIIALGALQSIPGEMYEAAVVDGANGWHRFWRITLPNLMIAVAPLLVGSFAFNFNNFNVIYLVTKGLPAIVGAQTPAGATDILISYTYRLAFEGGRGTQYGLASAVSIIIFIITATISLINFKLTGAVEEMSENV